MNPWTLQQRQSGQNSHVRQDVLWVTLRKNVIQATRDNLPVKLADTWIGHSCIGDIVFKSLDGARKFATEMGYNDILL